MIDVVTVVCLCYNHAAFVREAIDSVYWQTYPFVQLIVVDDASSDNSADIIHECIRGRNNTHFLQLTSNHGNCKAFNLALPLVTGKYVIDLAADDVLLPDRIARQVNFFEWVGQEYGIVFTDADYIDASGNFLGNHAGRLIKNGLVKRMPQGDVFAEVLKRYFISSPTMMIRKEVLDELNGYDETLAYEDFDLWVRAARNHKFAYLPDVTTLVRKVSGSMSTKAYARNDRQLFSTYQVCLKAKAMLQSSGERQALISRVRYELRQAVLSDNNREADLFYALLRELGDDHGANKFFHSLNKLRLPMAWLRNAYQRVRYAK